MKIQVHNIEGPDTLIYAIDFDAARSDKTDSYKQLAMLQWEGMYWLVPIEILWECAMLLKRRNKSEDTYNILQPVSITVQQCIPIPSETAKILLGL